MVQIKSIYVIAALFSIEKTYSKPNMQQYKINNENGAQNEYADQNK